MINNLEIFHPEQQPTDRRFDLEPKKEYKLYSHIAIQISELLSQLKYPQQPGLHGSLEEKYKRMETGVEYDLYSEEFASKYWLRNYWKAVYACENVLNLRRTIKVCSLGAGSGSDAVAVVTALCLQGNPSLLNLTLVDKSSRQLELAKHIISSIRPVLNGNNLAIERVHKEIQLFSSVQKFDLVMISHVLTENPNSLSPILTNAAGLLNESGAICIIERERDPVWNEAYNCLRDQSGLLVYHMPLNQPKLIDLLNPLGYQKATYLDMTPHYVVGIKKT